MNIFITGIGTGVGKTIVSAIMCEALEADYWKPVQSGDCADSDAMRVRQLVSNKKSVFHPEAYCLNLPASPHHAAAAEGKKIELRKLRLPATENHLIIEGAGGILVPLNQNRLYADWVEQHNLPVVLVSRHYLGSINHTLLSVEALRARDINILGIVFNGDEEKPTEQILLRMTGLKMLGRVRNENKLSRKVISTYAKEFKKIFIRIAE